MASPVPVLPDVGSMIVPLGRSRPSRSAASISRIATRSLIEPPGLKYSTLATTWGATPWAMRESRISGVLPIVSRIESLMSGCSAVSDGDAMWPLCQAGEVLEAVDARHEQVLAAAHGHHAR